jgi:AcrR family transcriptional regulator
VDRIAEAGLELLREDPGQQLTVERVAKRAEVATMTVYNLVGGRDELWTLLVDRGLGQLDPATIIDEDPRARALSIARAYVDAICADPAVFRALFSEWTGAGRVLLRDPTRDLTACLREAAESGQIDSAADVRELGEIMSAALLGTTHLWTVGYLSDERFRERASTLVEALFMAARHGALST